MCPSWTAFLESVILDILEIFDDNIMIYMDILRTRTQHHLHYISSEFAESMLYSCSIDKEKERSEAPARLLRRQLVPIGRNSDRAFKCMLKGMLFAACRHTRFTDSPVHM